MTPGSAATWVALLIIALDAPAPDSREPAVGLMNAHHQAQADVKAALDLARLSIKKGDLRGGLRAAEPADAQARRELHPVEAQRVEGTRPLAGARCRAWQ